MKTAEYEEVWYPASIYVWCKGTSTKLSRHPIFVSCPVKFTLTPNGRFTLQTCRDDTCSLCGQAIRYEEKDIGFQNGYAPPISAR